MEMKTAERKAVEWVGLMAAASAAAKETEMVAALVVAKVVRLVGLMVGG